MTGTVLLTGAAGTIGTALRERLPQFGWTLRSFDRVAVPDGLVGDVTSPSDLDTAMAGVDAVVHLAGRPNEVPWPVVREANIEGTFQLFEAARRAGVRRVVFASSNHAVGFTPNPPDGAELPADLGPRPDTLYGVSKVFAEALGRYYVERYGMQVACLRIGTFAETPYDRRSLATWLSPDDCARLVDACLSSDALTYALVWGVSANTQRQWSLREGEALGYHPQDDAETFAADLEEIEPQPSDANLGGGFTSPGFGIDEIAAHWAQNPW